ncbi:MAG: AraC family transcriptional regulator [Anaerolineae bacterium]|nr:AraC family transcriptional regulator [Anaerolineae bacterium]
MVRINPRFTIYPIPDDIIRQQCQHPLLAGLFPMRAGHYYQASGHVAERDTIGEYIIIYCHAGQGWLRMNGREHLIRPGDVLFVMQGCAHAYGANPHAPWSIHWSHFGGADVPALLDLAHITAAEPVIRVRDQVNVLALFNALAGTLQSGYSLHHLMRAAAILRHLLSELALLNVYTPTTDARGLDIEKTIQYMLEHLAESCSLDELAGQAHLSISHFSHQFRARTGYAPIDYFIRLKIQKACELLETTDMKIEEICYALGYADPYYFSRLFKKITSLPPSIYRERREIRAT